MNTNNTPVAKRSYISYSILNAVTLGIYGVVVRGQINNDIETICEGDGQQPEKSFGQAWIISKLYNLMMLGLIFFPAAVAGGIFMTLEEGIGFGLLAFLGVILAAVLLSFMAEGLYLPSWWYSQHNRLVLNAHRYKMVLNDNAFDTAVWKGLMFVPMNMLSIFGYLVLFAGFGGAIALAVMHEAGFMLLSVFLGYLLSAIILFIKNIINLPFYYTLKTINRYSENMVVIRPEPYDPMGLLDDDNKDNIFSRIINVLNEFGKKKEAVVPDTVTKIDPTPAPQGGIFEPKPAPPVASGKITCTKGANKGYVYSMSDSDEIIIGKDPKVANIIIPTEYTDVSRNHCSIKYNSSMGMYIVTDRSSNGTKVNGAKIESGKAVKVNKGSTISLGKGDNEFRVQ